MTSEQWQPYAGFGGTIRKTFADSESWWPPRTAPREGAPNVVVIVVDDLGYSDLGCYGSEIDTPHLDRLAAEGLRYTNFHVTPLCSPTRASLLTGCESHSVGFGFVANVDPGFPGYSSELPEGQPTMAEVFRDHGYSTMAVGKWHLCRETDMHDAGDRNSWPLQRGFDQYYGFLEALTNFHHPHRLYRGNEPVAVDDVPDGYYLTDDLTDQAIGMIRSQKTADPEKPFFLYLAHGAVHAPLHAKPDDLAKYRGRYGMGWDELRRQRFERQVELGVVEPGTELAPRNTEVPEDVVPWDSLSQRERELYERYMECYAAMVDNVDQNTGRLLDALAELGVLDDTLVVFFSDNGASREGQQHGTTNYFGGKTSRIPVVGMVADDVLDADHARLDEIGGPTTWPHYPRGWAMASNTPFRLYKMTAFAGGHQVAFVARWPERLREAGGIRRQFTHVTDLLDTFADLFGFTVPASRHGQPAAPRVGASFVPTLADADAPSAHDENFIEVIGHRSFYRQGWEIATFHTPDQRYDDTQWQLYHVAADPTQLHDLAAARPDKLGELAAAWEAAARTNQTYPLTEGAGLSRVIRAPGDERFKVPLTIPHGTPTLERVRASRLIQDGAFSVTVALGAAGLGARDEGVLVAHGGQEGGYVLYVEDGALVFAQNVDGAMREVRVDAPVHSREITLDVAAPGKRVWDVTLTAGGRTLGTLEGCFQYAGFLPFEGIDVGIDRRSPVSWAVYQRHRCFPFTGDLRSVRYTPGADSPDSPFARIPEMRAMALKYD